MTTATSEVRHGLAPTDDQLMAGLEAGDVEASLAALRRRYERRLHRLIRDVVRDPHLADDVSQEVFVKLFFKGHLYRPGSNFQAWLFEIAKNQARSAIRSRRCIPRPLGEMELWGEGDDVVSMEALCGGYEDQRLHEEELMGRLDEAVERLPENYRLVFRLCVQGGMQYRDAAKTLGIPTGTVAIRIMRARRRLFAELSDYLGHVRRPPACMQ